MKRMMIASMGIFSVLALSLSGCGRDEMPRPTGEVDAMPPDPAAQPSMPALGTQVDRVGRPLVSTMLLGTFFEEEGDRDAMRDSYNLDADRGSWVERWAPRIQPSIALFDALDSEGEANEFGCNNPLALLGTDADPPLNRYQGMARFLADDVLYVDSSQANCEDGFMGYDIQAFVEGNEITGCGGRRPTDDVVNVLYNLLIGGPGVRDHLDGVTGDDGGDIAAANNDSFPFLGVPHEDRATSNGDDDNDDDNNDDNDDGGNISR